MGVQAEAFAADQADPAAVGPRVEAVMRRFGEID